MNSLLTPLTIKSFCPSLHVTDTPLCWCASYLTGGSFKVSWRREVYEAHQLVPGYTRGQYLDPSSSPYTYILHHWNLFNRHMASPSNLYALFYHCIRLAKTLAKTILSPVTLCYS